MENGHRRLDAPHGRQHYTVTLAVLAVGALAFALLQTMVVPALPDMQHALHTSTTSIAWVLTIYLLSASVATPVVGRLGDIFGKEHTLLAVLVIFALGSLTCALSHSLGVLIIGRAVQGAGGAIFPLSFGIIRDEFPRERVAAGIGLISATFGVGGGAGLVLSGVIVDHLSYEWIFWLGLVITVIAMVTTRLFVPESPIKSPARIDWWGAAFLSGGLVCLLLGVSQANAWGWGSPRIVALFAGAALLLVGFGWFELRVPEPLVDMRLMRRRSVWTTNLAGLLVGFGMFGSFLLIPQFVRTPLQAGYGFGATVIEAGIFLLPAAAVMLIAGPLAGALGTRFGSRLPLQLGALITAAAFGVLAAAHAERWQIYLGSALLGVGIGFAFASMANLVVEAVPAERTGEATGINTIMRTVGGALGAQISASIISAHITAGGRFPSEDGYTVAFLMSCLTLLIALAASLAIPRRQAPAAIRLTLAHALEGTD
jgi:EmrB/QacA subfamily drug resistance transporter